MCFQSVCRVWLVFKVPCPDLFLEVFSFFWKCFVDVCVFRRFSTLGLLNGTALCPGPPTMPCWAFCWCLEVGLCVLGLCVWDVLCLASVCLPKTHFGQARPLDSCRPLQKTKTLFSHVGPRHRNSADFGAAQTGSPLPEWEEGSQFFREFVSVRVFFLRFPGFRGFPGFSLRFGEGEEG